jgi:hypothetical protein
MPGQTAVAFDRGWVAENRECQKGFDREQVKCSEDQRTTHRMARPRMHSESEMTVDALQKDFNGVVEQTVRLVPI